MLELFTKISIIVLISSPTSFARSKKTLDAMIEWQRAGYPDQYRSIVSFDTSMSLASQKQSDETSGGYRLNIGVLARDKKDGYFLNYGFGILRNRLNTQPDQWGDLLYAKGGLAYRLTLRSKLGVFLTLTKQENTNIAAIWSYDLDPKKGYFHTFDYGLHFQPKLDNQKFYMSLGFSVGHPKGKILAEKKKRVRLILTDNGLLFNSGSSLIIGKGQSYLIALAKALKKHDNNWSSLEVEGHTDRKGGYELNMKLSKQRAQMVLELFKKIGISVKKMQAVGYGYHVPKNNKKTTEIQKENRRVVITISTDLKGHNILKDSIRGFEKKYGTSTQIDRIN